MEMTTRELMRADPDVIFGLAVAVEAWPTILPHYRWVRVLRERGPRRLVEMAAHRDGFPVRWMATQEVDPAGRRIAFRHVQGITRGMEVAWTLTPGTDGVDVAIWHAFRPPWPLVPDPLVSFVIGELFVENIARKTLRCIKQLAEAQTRAAAGRVAPVVAAGASGA
jgi:ribosome-associated toxin RatA of RatAB toxin-antitoxin module